MSDQPVKKFRVGSVTASVWKNDDNHSVTLQKSYQRRYLLRRSQRIRRNEVSLHRRKRSHRSGRSRHPPNSSGDRVKLTTPLKIENAFKAAFLPLFRLWISNTKPFGGP
jgi:hypothetical protein